ncbi:hypothetical protein BC830DRAFT_1158746, partial [Chytriomyces sp. MP71]
MSTMTSCGSLVLVWLICSGNDRESEGRSAANDTKVGWFLLSVQFGFRFPVFSSAEPPSWPPPPPEDTDHPEASVTPTPPPSSSKLIRSGR